MAGTSVPHLETLAEGAPSVLSETGTASLEARCCPQKPRAPFSPGPYSAAASATDSPEKTVFFFFF